MDIDYPDLESNIWTNPDEVEGNDVDDNNNGYIDDGHGWDFYHDDASVYDRGEDEHSTHVAGILPNNTYGSYSGTSMATPHVAGVAALVKSNDPSLDDAGIKARLLGNVDKKSGLTGKTATGGRLNAATAVGPKLDSSAPAPAGDTTAPTVASMRPADGATGIGRYANVAATFSEEMDKATLTPSTMTLVKAGSTTPVTAKVTTSTDGKTVTLDPSARLARGAKYTATIKGGTSGVKDKAGNPLAADKVWSFTVRR